jgi:hypothetical protein
VGGHDAHQLLLAAGLGDRLADRRATVFRVDAGCLREGPVGGLEREESADRRRPDGVAVGTGPERPVRPNTGQRAA